MSNKAGVRKFFQPLDFFIIIFFLFIAALGFELFRRDLLQTFSLQNEEPVGTIVVKKNVVQRRITDRVVWDRLAAESPVYVGDLIRVADISFATLTINSNSLDISENTIIRITRAADGEGVKINLSEGSLSLAVSENSSGMTIEMKGQTIQTGSGTVLSVASSEEGQSVMINNGTAQYISSSGAVREINTGALISVDTEGKQRLERAAVFTQPRPNARFVKTSFSPLSVNIAWNRVNIESNLRLRLEIARDSGFSGITQTINNLDRNTQVQLNAGSWHYRLAYQDEILGTGQLTVADGSEVNLLSPAFNSIIKFNDVIPAINFQWAMSEEADSYIFEISNSANFSSVHARAQTSSVTHSVSNLAQGMWYWRVQPVFPAVYNNSGGFSSPSFFRIEKTSSNNVDVPSNGSVSTWLAAEAPSNVLPPEVPRDIIPVSSMQSTSIIPQIIPEPEPTPTPPPPPRPAPAPTPAPATSARTAPARTPPAPVQLLPAPRIVQPPSGASLGYSDLAGRTVTFRWSSVQGANAYIFTLFQITHEGRRQIIRETINSATSFTLNNLRLLSRGTFLFQVEPLNIRNSTIEQRGNIGERTFIIDIPAPGPVQTEDTGILYGN